MSWHYSQALEAEFSEANSLDGKPSAPWKSIPSAPDDSCSGKMKATFHRSPYGTMFVPSTDAHGEALLTWFRAGFPVRTYPQQDAVLESQENEADFGAPCSEWFAKFDRLSYSWKTPHCSLFEDLAPSLVIWPPWGTMQDGACSRLRMWEGDMGADESSYSGLCPTPLATERGGRHRAGSTLSLSKWINGWRKDGSKVHPDAGPLNPQYSEHVMGWPIDWTACTPLETDKFQVWLDSHGKPSQENNERS